MKNIKIKITKESLLVGMILLLGAFIPVFLMSKNSPLYPFNDWYDINIIFSVGKGMLYGKAPYVDLVDHKGPFVFFLAEVAYIIDRTGFFGWFVLEVLNLFVFSLFSYKTLCLFSLNKKLSVFVPPLVCCIIVLSTGFQHGESAEELSLWIMSIALYSMLKMIKSEDAPKLSIVLGNGILFGLLFWSKFTMTGIYIVWIIWLCFFIKKRNFRHILMFGAGFIIATLPWLFYFGSHHAVYEWLDTYVIRNVFGYGSKESISLVQRLVSVVVLLKGFLFRRQNLPILALFALTVLYYLVPHKNSKISLSERICVIFMMAMTSLGVYAGGFDYGYYGLILCAYIVIGAVPLIGIAQRLMKLFSEKKKNMIEGIVCFALMPVLYIGFVAFSFARSDNTYMLDMKKEELPQYVFADIINSSPEDERVLLNYGFLDAGVYTVLDQVPQMKYFSSNNSDYEKIMEIQSDYIRNEIPDYVLTFYPVAGTEEQISDVPVLKDDYHVVSYVYHYIEGGERTYVLWARNK